MKNKTTTLAVLALLGVSMVLVGCPGHFRPRVPGLPGPSLPHPLLPSSSMLQLEIQSSVADVTSPSTEPAIATAA